MTISEPFIRRPVMTAVLTVSVILFGAISYTQLAVNDLPAVDYPVISVTANYPGASPETMANNIATPLERQFMQIPGLELVTSTSTQGNVNFTLQFALEKSIDAAATDVQTAITQATGQLPVDLPSPPSYTKTNPNDQPILYIPMTSDSITSAQLYDYASTQVGQRISILPGVSRVNVFGTKGAVRIKANPSAMWARGISTEDLANAVKGGTSYAGAGQFDGTSGTLLLKPHGQLESAEDYNNLIVAGGRSPVYLRDVATATNSVQDERVRTQFWLRGYDVPAATVVVGVFRRAGANAVEVAESIKALLPAIRQELPASVRLVPSYDRSQTIVNSIDDVQQTLVIAFVLVVLVIFIFLGRATDTLIPAFALPLSLLLTFVVMKILGYSLDNLSLMALTLAIGFLVDDAIVFLENTVRRMEAGEPALEATLASASEISFTILSMTISLAAVFLPLVFMPGLVGRIFREFAITIVVSILASGIVSLTLTPLMCARLLKERGPGTKHTLMERMIGAVEKRVLDFYGRTLTWFLKWRFISAIVWVICLAGTVWLFRAVPKAFLPPGDSGFIRGVFIAREGSSPEQMHAYQDQVAKVIREDPNTLSAFTLSGNSAQIAANQGIAGLFLKDVKERQPIQIANQNLIRKINEIPGVLAFLQPNPVLQISTGATNVSQGQYAYSLSGVDPDQVHDAALKLLAKLREYQGFATVSSDYFANTPSLDININRDQAKSRGVSEARILTLLRNAYSQNYLYLIKRPTDQYQVILEVDDKQRSQASDLTLLYIKSDDGKNLIPLKELVTWKQTLGPQSVNHLNQFTSVTIFFNLKPGVAIGDATNFIERASGEVVPSTVRGSLQGEALTFRDTVQQLTLLMGLAVFVMYVILAILYESYLHPLTVLSTLPTALVGGLLTLYLFHEQASLYAFVGMFMLMGIVKKNGIMIVDFAIQRIEQGKTPLEAIHEASMDRFRPIVMTTLAAVIGAVPIAAGYGADGASRRPLGLVIVGGLVVSQFITLYVTPVIYLYLEDFQEKVLDKTSFFHSIHSRPHTAILLLCVLLFSTSCVQRPVSQRPVVNAPDAFRGAPPATTATPTSIGDQKWWDVFQDEALQGLVRKALADNYDVKIAASRMLQAEQQIIIARAAQLPVLNGTANMGSQRSAKSGPFPAFGVTSAQLGVSGSWNADFWGKYRDLTDAARANLLATEWAKQEVLTTLVANVAGGYFNLRQLDLELEVAKHAIDTRREGVSVAKTQEEHGLVSMIDVRQAETLVQTAAAQIPVLEKQIEQQENALSVLLANNPGAIARGRTIDAQPHLPEVPAGLPSALLERRPDIREIEEHLVAADAQIAAARADFFPQISLTGTGGFQSSALTRFFSGSGFFGSLAGGALGPIFNAGRIRANVRLTEEQQRELVLTYQKTVQEAFREVSDALAAYRKNREFREAQQVLLDTTRESARLARLRYNAGETNYLEVLTNESNAFAAELTLAQARGGELQALVQIYQALGGGWQQ